MTLQVEGTVEGIASFYLQRHSLDVLNQALPPLFDGGSKAISKNCARKRESLGRGYNSSYGAVSLCWKQH